MSSDFLQYNFKLLKKEDNVCSSLFGGGPLSNENNNEGVISNENNNEGALLNENNNEGAILNENSIEQAMQPDFDDESESISSSQAH